MSTPILPFAVWASGTNQNSIPANDNSLRSEILNGLVISESTNAQPATPDDGDIYIITGAATGAQWATFDQFDLTIFSGGTWYAYAPVEGIVVNVAGTLKRWSGAAYVDAASGSGSGDVVGPASSTMGNFALFGDTTGKLIADGGVPGDMAFIDDAPSDTTGYVRKDGAWAAESAGGAAWGGITGTLSAQTDLQAALDAKVATTALAADSGAALVGYDNATSGLTATDVQAALDEVAAGSGGGGSGDVVGPASATADAVALFDGTTGKLLKDGVTIAEIRRVAQNSQSAAYTLVLSDAGKHILHPSADTTARTFTIPANSSVAFPVGTVVTFVNQNAGGVITIAITTDTMRLAGAGTTGSRTLAANGIATAIKVTSTEWLINGTGLT
jgi:hypothetical protein